MTPLSSDLQEILDCPFCDGTKTTWNLKADMYEPCAYCPEAIEKLTKLIQSRERAARIDELASLQRIAMFMSDVFGREQAMTSQISDRIATLSNNEEL